MTEGLTGPGDDQLSGAEGSSVRFLHPHHAPPVPHRFNELPSRLVGYRVQWVQFTDGYVQVGFGSAEAPDAPVLTCEVMPVVVTHTGPIGDGQVGYADAIRSLIGRDVVDTSEASGEGLQIEFAGGALQLRPAAAEITGPVIAVLSDFADGRSFSWRPGGEGYEYLR